jgi:hypothetical protein
MEEGPSVQYYTNDNVQSRRKDRINARARPELTDSDTAESAEPVAGNCNTAPRPS